MAKNPNPRSPNGNGHKAAKMQTIADALNISVATVSRALRRVPGINADTRAQVFATAAQLGYRLSDSYRAQEINDGSLRHVGVLIQTPQTQAPAPLYLVGMSEAAMSLNASLVVHYVTPDQCERLLDPKFQPRAMQSGLLAGVIFVFRWPIEVVREINKRWRAVSIMNRYPGVDMDMIGVDNHEGTDLLVRHLHGLGHRKIGFLGRCGELHWDNQRFGGYVASMTNLGLGYRPEWVIDMTTESLTIQQAPAAEVMSKVERITREEGVRAWICATETAGQQLHRWMTSRGLRVPEDVSVTGFHRNDLNDESAAHLTTVLASYQGMGAAALARLLYRAQSPAESFRSILFPFELCVGKSTGAPPASAS